MSPADVNSSGNHRGMHPRSRAALVPGGVPPAPAGNRRHVTHGAFAAVAADRLAAKQRVVFDALAADAPLRDADGELPAADGGIVKLAAEAMCRLDDVADFLARRGIEDEKGELRLTALAEEGRLRREVKDYLVELGMTTKSRAALGVDVARVASIDPLTDWHRRRGAAIDAEASS